MRCCLRSNGDDGKVSQQIRLRRCSTVVVVAVVLYSLKLLLPCGDEVVMSGGVMLERGSCDDIGKVKLGCGGGDTC